MNLYTSAFNLTPTDAGWSQNARLLVLTTPAGPDVLIAETVRVDEALGPVGDHAGYRLELTALSTDAALSLNGLLGQPARLDLQTSGDRRQPRPFHGHLTQITRQGANGGFARYRLVIEPWLAFLGHTRDSYLFQDKSVIEIIDEVISDRKGQGPLDPAWRWDLADATRYPKRGMTVQYRESDLAFIKRLLAEEGLFCWFDHQAGEGAPYGRHTLVIADHNGAFRDNVQATQRFTQSGATLAEDSHDRWTGRRRIDTTETYAQSWDYRSCGTRPQSAASPIANGRPMKLAAWHDPGQYAWPTSAHGERLLGARRQALDARLKHFHGEGTVRTAAPGTTFTLTDHPDHDGHGSYSSSNDRDNRFLITAVTHIARNNLNDTVPDRGLLAGFSGAFPGKLPDATSANAPPVDLYRNQLTALRAHLPWRPSHTDAHGRALYPRPAAPGVLTAVVIGAPGDKSSVTHTDRDGRIRVQFPWQRGQDSASRFAHPSGADNAPADARLGVWLRLLTPVAGANWGGHLIPRPGQEVLVAFQHGNIDRPVIVGAAYNGRGQPDTQANRLASGTQHATPNAPAWFAGQAGEHAHGAALSGLKTQQLSSTRSGQGGANQLLFDDTPGEARLELATTEHHTRLQLGHLKQQTGNARQAHRGHGGELATQAACALRAGSGLLISADARTQAASDHLDSREPIAQTHTAHDLVRSLADVAAKQHAALAGDPAAADLPATQSLHHAAEVMSATQSAGGAGANATPASTPGDTDRPAVKATRGGDGTVAAWSEARLQYAAPGGIAQLTPADGVLVAGGHLSLVSGHDTQLLAQGHHRLAVAHGLVLFTVGQAADPKKPNRETGIHLHAASGAVSVQAQSGKIAAAADKQVTIASTHAGLKASAKTTLLATAQGATLTVKAGRIELHAPGKVEFKATRKNWTGPGSVSDQAKLPEPKIIPPCAQRAAEAASDGAGVL